MNYYEEITEELKTVPEGVKIADAVNGLFQTCQKYAWLHGMNEAVNPAKNVLQNYFEEGEGITNQPIKEERARRQSLSIPTKLYIEFSCNLYTKYYTDKTEKDFFKEIINSYNRQEKIKQLLLECNKSQKEKLFSNEKELISLANAIDSSIHEWMDFDNATCMKNLSLEKLHNAMKIVDDVDSSMPSIAESVEEIIVADILQSILDDLRNKQYPSVLFTVAPITKALTIGKVSNYTPIKENTNIFFTKAKFSYNCPQLEENLIKIQDLYDEYMELKGELNEILSKL